MLVLHCYLCIVNIVSRCNPTEWKASAFKPRKGGVRDPVISYASVARDGHVRQMSLARPFAVSHGSPSSRALERSGSIHTGYGHSSQLSCRYIVTVYPGRLTVKRSVQDLLAWSSRRSLGAIHSKRHCSTAEIGTSCRDTTNGTIVFANATMSTLLVAKPPGMHCW